ncbi:MAG: hypothetical protein ACUVQY_07315 [Thermoproteota archaeon]
MSNHYLELRVSSKTPWRARKELKKLAINWIIDWYVVGFMQHKGFKYIPAILYNAAIVEETAATYLLPSIEPSRYLPRRIGLSLSHFEEVVEAFKELEQNLQCNYNHRLVRRNQFPSLFR